MKIQRIKDVKIAPSILSADFTKLGEDIRQCEEAKADLLHLDIMDGHFVPNISYGPPIVKAIRKATELPLDVHLMIENPDFYVPEFAKIGVEMISIHVEATRHLHRSLSLIKSFGIKAGIVLNPLTPIQYAYEAAEYCDFILLMSVNPGFGGQNFIPSTIRKCERLKIFLIDNQLDVEIEVDGGLNVENSHIIMKAGADIIVSGSGIFSGDIKENIKLIREQVS